MIRQEFWPTTRDGWRLEVLRRVNPARVDRSRRPLLFIPGYGMNSFILGYHPTGLSMVEYLVERGFEVWTANLRGQGEARPQGDQRAERFGFRELALIDIPRVLDLVREETGGNGERVDVVGCSLGATVLYSYLAHHPEEHPVGSMVAIGGPLRWTRVHPLLAAAFRSPTLVGAIPFVGTRQLARVTLPVVQRFPLLLSIYMNADRIDLSNATELVKTVDDPVPYLNRQIAHWVNKRDLVVGGLDVTEAMGRIKNVPLLCVLANRDGIVPPEAALSVLDHIGSKDTDTLIAGDTHGWYAHADLFIANDAQDRVFAPMADWLEARTSGHAGVASMGGEEEE